ncbi:MAG: L-arabinose isomerase [Fimbriimonadaceae bacterium]|jgi:L-arabinose isomerase|nr:L-arabinose isomerase [Fimbriimonadaceae bacterium]
MSQPAVWFVTGSQHLYGPAVLAQVAEDSQQIAAALSASNSIPMEVVFKPVITDADSVRKLVLDANGDPNCTGLIFWMHTFSPAKMWIGGLSQLHKPALHLHTQFNESLPFATIDMDFMNLNQAAHGDREAGHLHTRIGLKRKVVVGHWGQSKVQEAIGSWGRVALAWNDWQGAKFARFGDNMRMVSVTDGDKVSAEIQLGFTVDGFGVGDLVSEMAAVSPTEVAAKLEEYGDLYDLVPELQIGGARRSSLEDGARQEIAIQGFLDARGYKGFTTTFEDLHGLDQLPGFAAQRLMAKGYGFGAEGDWKTAALLRAFKQMESGLIPGTSFMEDYTYHMVEGEECVLGAHMLEICPTIAMGKPKLEIHPLGIGGKADPIRLVFEARPGPATNTTLIDLGDRFRFMVNSVTAIAPPPMPHLPVARALWEVKPNFADGLACWILGGGAHHTAYSYNVSVEMVEDFAMMCGCDCLVIDEETTRKSFQRRL